MIFNNFFIDVTYSLIRVPYHFLRPIVKPRKRIFVNSEKDIIRFINNLTTDNILEKSEAKLVQSAFNFDELKVSEITTPEKKLLVFIMTCPTRKYKIFIPDTFSPVIRFSIKKKK